MKRINTVINYLAFFYQCYNAPYSMNVERQVL